MEWSALSPQRQQRAAQDAIERATALNATLHAFVEICRGQSFAAPQGPLALMPYAAKDLFFAPGHRPRAGLVDALDPYTDGYADVLASLDGAGARRIGFTAMTELAYEPSGFNAVSEPARNPWNPEFVPGGSSSGSAVAVASGSALFALGSDTGGSIRIPAHCCGVTGWKPTWGALSAAGVVALAPFLDSVGVLARGAADLAAVASLLAAGLGPRAPIEHVVVCGDAINGAQAPVPRACEDGIEALRGAGVRVTGVDALAAIAGVDQHALIVMQGEAARIHADRLDRPAIGPVLRKRLAKGLAIEEETLSASRAVRPRLVEQFEAVVFGSADAAILPVMPVRTPRYVEVDPQSPAFNARQLYDLSRYTRFVNMLGLPAVAVPVGFDDRGLPVAMQMIGRAGRDHDLIALAMRLQQSSDWHARIPAALGDAIDINAGLSA
jgi:aspartyl-tRNA(Asn)/glutamyl-tRNA(Gln) amidotransferase subunit A